MANIGYVNPYADVAKQLENRVLREMNSLTPDKYANLNDIVSKYPNISKDLALSMVQQGLTSKTPGIDKIVSVDGISQLKADAANVDKIAASVKAHQGILSLVKDGFSNFVYDPIKATSRVAFATLRSPYDYLTTNFRNAYDILHDRKVGATDAIQALSPMGLFGESTELGQIMRGFAGSLTGKGGLDTGNGFFVSPESKVGKAQAEAMGAYGAINGKSFTIGRMALNGMGSDPNSTTYRIMSGVVDATLNVLSDPTTWFGPGSAKAIIKSSAERAAIKAAAKKYNPAEQQKLIDDAKALLDEKNKIAAQKSNQLKANKRRKADDNFLKAEQEYHAAVESVANGEAAAAKKLFDSEVERSKAFSQDKNAQKILAPDNIIKSIMEDPRSASGELVETLSRTSADYKNTQGLFAGAVHLDEVPEAGKLSFGAHNLDEYAVTVSGKKGLNLVDMSQDIQTLGKEAGNAEYIRRVELITGIQRIADEMGAEIGVRTQNALLSALEKINPDVLNDASLISLTTNKPVALADLLRPFLETKDAQAIQIVSDRLKFLWKADGFTNTRSLFGGTGGVAIVNSAKLAASKLKVSESIAGVGDQLGMAGVVGKLYDSLAEGQNAVEQARLAMVKAGEDQVRVKKQIKELAVLRDYAAQDPNLINEIVKGAKGKDLKKIIDLDLEIGQNNALKELIAEDLGLVSEFGGALGDDASKTLQYYLGRRFRLISQVVAKETDIMRVDRFFGKKLSTDMVKELTDAKTSDDVMRIFLEYIGASETDPAIFKSLALRKEANALVTNPVAKLVNPINLAPLKMAEKVEKRFGRYYVRTVALSLDDNDRLIRGVEDWLSSALTKSWSPAGNAQVDDIIATTVKAIYNAKTNGEKAKVVNTAMAKAQEFLAKQYGVTDEETLKQLSGLVRLSAKQEGLIKRYNISRIGTDDIPELGFANGEVVQLPAYMMEWQILDDTVRLPDTKEITKALLKFQKNKVIFGARAGEMLLGEVGDLWRTTQLVFRMAYIARNIAEMQMRMYFSGHASLLSHPLQMIAMMMADPDGGKVGKFFAKYSRYNKDLSNNYFKSAEAEGDLLQGVVGWREKYNRQMSAASYTGQVAKYYDVLSVGQDGFYKGYAFHLDRIHTDRIARRVAGIADTDEAGKLAYVDELINPKEGEADVLKELYEATYDKNIGYFKQLILKDPKGDFSKTNLDRDKIYTWLFDAKQESSYIGQINLLTGTGPKSHLIRELIAKGSVQVGERDGVPIFLNVPLKTKSLNEAAAREEKFKSALYKYFSEEDIAGARTLVQKEKVIGYADNSMLNLASQWFFNLAVKAENVTTFGPEYTMAYWDYVGRYISMVDDEGLKYIKKMAKESLSGITIKGDPITKPRLLRAIEKEFVRREKRQVVGNDYDWQTIHRMAAENAGKYTEGLFYEAFNQRQLANAYRLLFPFVQAHGNTLAVWGRLWKENPLPVYRFGKTFDALTQKDSNAIYDLSNVTYDENQGFLYKDQNGDTRFRYPIAGSFMGALVGRSIDATQAVQLTAPVQSLNLAFGSVNPGVPGLGFAPQLAFLATGKSRDFGPVNDILRNIIMPYGEPKSFQDIALPSWFNGLGIFFNFDEQAISRSTKDWASYLASTGEYGDNPLVDDAQRVRLFEDARSMAKGINGLNAIFKSILPATPSTEVLARIKTNENKGNFMLLTSLYDHWDKINDKHPDNFNAAINEYADIYGWKNLLVTMGSTSRGATRGTTDAWNFLNNNPEMANKYARPTNDVVPYFFPGGDYSSAYYNWQKRAGSRRTLSTSELENAAEALAYKMRLSRITEQQAEYGYADIWYTEQVAKLNADFGGAPPAETITTGADKERIAAVGKALNETAFQKSPIYKETAEFYSKYIEYQTYLNELKIATGADIGARGGLATSIRGELEELANTLITNNPAFARMYYGVFAGSIKQNA